MDAIKKKMSQNQTNRLLETRIINLENNIDGFFTAINKAKDEEKQANAKQANAKPMALEVAVLEQGEIYACLVGNKKIMYVGKGRGMHLNNVTGKYEQTTVLNGQLTIIK